MTAHALLSASGMHRWSACPGSVSLTASLKAAGLIVDRVTSYQAEGSAAHELGEKCLRQGADAEAYVTHWLNTEGNTPVQVSDEMAEAVQVYLDYVRSIGAGSEQPGERRFFIEQTFDLSAFYPGLFGTADCVCFHIPSRTLFVIDFKYGQGVAVEAIGNLQLRYYALGALVKLQELGLAVAPEHVCMVVVQPRAPHAGGPVRNEVLSAMALLMWVDELIAAAKATEAPDAPLVAGEHCRFCPAQGRCPELLRLAQESAQLAFKPVERAEVQDMSGPTPVSELTHEQLRRALLASTVLEPWLKELHAHAQELLERGGVIDGWKLVPKRAMRRWAGDPFDIASALQILGLQRDDIYEEPALRSPAQIEKLLPRARHPELAPLVIKESSGVTLAPEADPRPAVRVALPFKVLTPGVAA